MPNRSKPGKKKGSRTANNNNSKSSKKNFKKKHQKKTFQNNKRSTNLSLDNEMFDFDGPIPQALLPTSMTDALNTKRKINSRFTKNTYGKQANYRKMPVFEKLRFFPVAFVKATEVYDPSALLNSKLKRQRQNYATTKHTKEEISVLKISVEFSEKQPSSIESIDSCIPVHTISEENQKSNITITDNEISDGSIIAKKQVNLETKLENLNILDSAAVKNTTYVSGGISNPANKNSSKSKGLKPSLNTEDIDFTVSDLEYDYEEDHSYTYPYDSRVTIQDKDEINNFLAEFSDFDDGDNYESENDQDKEFEQENNQKVTEKENLEAITYDNDYGGKQVSTTIHMETITDSLGNTIYQEELSELDDSYDQYSLNNDSDYSEEENNQEGYFEDEMNDMVLSSPTKQHSSSSDESSQDSLESEEDQTGDMNEDISAQELLNIGRFTGVKFGGINSHIVDDYMDDVDPYITQSVRYKGKGKNKRPILENSIDDIDLINDLNEQFSKRRLSKNDKKQLKKQNKRNGNLISNLKDLSRKYPFAMDVNDINSEIIDFLEDPKRVALTFPSLGNLGNSEVMHHCSFYNTKSRVMGTNNKKYVVAIKTKKTHRIGQVFTRLPKVSTASQTTIRVFERTDVKLGRRDKKATVGYKHAEGAKVGENAPEIDENNIGKQLLIKLGWSSGEGLGAAHNKGISEPLVATFKRSKQGLRIIDS